MKKVLAEFPGAEATDTVAVAERKEAQGKIKEIINSLVELSVIERSKHLKCYSIWGLRSLE